MPPRGEPLPRPGGRRRLYLDRNLQVIFSVTLMAVLGVVSVTPAFPRLARELALEPAAVGRLITVFTLPGVFLTPVLGVLADRWGRKQVLIPALLLFATAGSLCALAADFRILLILRFLQGVGAAGLGSLNVTLIGDLYGGVERATAIGYNGTVLSMGTALYPALGGAVATLGWRWPFALPLAAFPVALFVLRNLSPPRQEPNQALSAYLLDVLALLRSRRVGALFATGLVTFILLYGPFLTFFPFLLARRFGSGSLAIGAVLSAASVTTALASSQLGRLVRRVAEVTLVKAAFGLYAAALLLIPLAANPWQAVVPSLLFGAATGINLPSVLTLLAGQAPPEHRAAFMSLNGTVFRLGQTLGPLLAGAALGAGGLTSPFTLAAALALAMVAALTATLR